MLGLLHGLRFADKGVVNTTLLIKEGEYMCKNSWKWMAVAILVVAVSVAGCSKKQTVKSDVDSVPAPVTEETSGKQEPVEQQPVEAARPVEVDPGVAVTEEQVSSFADALFEFDRFDLTEAGRKTSQEVAAYMRKNPNAKLLIEGHCDIRGTAEYNMALGDRRAASVQNYLVSLGVPAAAISTTSYGKERPLDSGISESAHARNRRAHFVLK